MKKYLSVYMLMTRATFHKVLILFLCFVILQSGYFYLALNDTLTLYQGIEIPYDAPVSLMEHVFENSHTALFFGLAFIVLTFVLCGSWRENGSKPGYTFRRLNVSEKYVMICSAIYNASCYAILIFIEIIVSFLLCQLYMARMHPEMTSIQSIFLAYYRNDFLHSILPLDEISGLIRNILMVLCLGYASADFPYRRRYGRLGMNIVFLSVMTLMFFISEVGLMGMDVFICIVFIASAVEITYFLIRDNKEEDENVTEPY